MRLLPVLLFALIVRVDLRRQTADEIDDLLDTANRYMTQSKNKEYLPETNDDEEPDRLPSFAREKKYSSRKKVLDDPDDDEQQDKPRRTHASKSNNRSASSETNSRAMATSTIRNYADEASLCINEFDVKPEQLVKVKDLKNGAHMIRFVLIDEPSSSHGLDIKDICMLNCCVEKNCDLAMLSEQRTKNAFKCYLFACNGSCTYAPHRDYTSMVLKKDLDVDPPASSNKPTKTNDKGSDATSSTLSSTCRSTEFSCRDGSCIPYYDVCNSYEDCPSGIDEAMCSPEFLLHQRTQQENRKKPSADVDAEVTTELDEVLDELLDEDATTTPATVKPASKPSAGKSSKSKSTNREGVKPNKNSSSSFLYNVDLDTQDRVSKLQKLKEHLEETKGPEAWYHLFQTLIQHQQQDHSNLEPESSAASSSSAANDEDSFKDNLLALEQQWIADRQKTTTTSTTRATTTTSSKSKSSNRKTTTKRTKAVNEDRSRGRRPPVSPDDELTEQEEEEDGAGAGAGDDADRYYWQPSYDDRRGDRYSYQQKTKSSTVATTRRSKTKNPSLNRDSTMATLLRANGVEPDNLSHSRSFLRESSVILLLLVGLLFTVILLVLVGFYCRDSCKRGRVLKSRSTDADYLINGLYL